MGKTSKSRTSKRKMKSKRHNMTSKKNSRKSVTRRRRMKGGRDYFGNTMRTFQNRARNATRKASNAVRSKAKEITNSKTFQTLKETRPSRSIKSMRNRIGSKLEGAKQKLEGLYSSQGDEQDGVRKIEACTCPPNLKG